MQELVGTISVLSLVSLLLSGCMPNPETSADMLDPSISFEQYVQECGKQYSSDQLEERRKLFTKAAERVASHNAQGSSWTAGLNCHSDSTESEKRSRLGYKKPRSRGTQTTPDGTVADGSAASSDAGSLDWRSHTPSIVTPPKNQGFCGSCWAFAAAEVMESVIALETGTLLTLSPQELISCNGGGGCGGGYAQEAFDYVIDSKGLSTTATYVYTDADASTGEKDQDPESGNYLGPVACEAKFCTSQCDSADVRAAGGILSYKSIRNNGAEIMRAVSAFGPAAVAVEVTDAWNDYQTGVFDECGIDEVNANHAVVLMGWGEDNGKKFWLIRNSWGSTWGEQGYIRLRRATNGEEECAIDKDGYEFCGECGVLGDVAYVEKGGFLTTDWKTSNGWR